ncbi:uncharacterized protein AMSG_11888 [Thecamonas trahens ATCC 50062]|uniref:mitogen-activated protein kinase kinase n=1 Tax=Thecamonas trahens ATCC 50062 TaxID=461836 RepID=A0A0L0DB26_THETB|nr:hypothetical protein AMSG_11888 [Thecamonas trahens ATCC 50062]KNC49532.1 hypothetical protein AMSG_11888 [Thecamonas trahens ATCC 50062]|eukprot:XP_013757762.1 hypothetical protein AMSG_11888 [Thecamonas trahens ATCC 50062]
MDSGEFDLGLDVGLSIVMPDSDDESSDGIMEDGRIFKDEVRLFTLSEHGVQIPFSKMKDRATDYDIYCIVLDAKLKNSPHLMSTLADFDSDAVSVRFTGVGAKSCEPLRQLGRGQFGTVDLVRDSSQGKLYALKRVNVESVIMADSARKHLVSEFQALFLASISDKLDGAYKPGAAFIVKFYGGFYWHRHIHLVTEYMNAGTLQSFIDNTEYPLPEAIVGKIAYCLVSAVSFLKSIKMMHRDIKPENVLLNSQGIPKLVDLGLAANLQASIANSLLGDLEYLAPEQLRTDDNGNPYPYTVKADVYSVGLTVLELALGFHPINGTSHGGPKKNVNELHLLQAIANGNIAIGPAAYSDDYLSFVLETTALDPEERPLPTELLEDDPWLAEHVVASETDLVDVQLLVAPFVPTIDPDIDGYGSYGSLATTTSGSNAESAGWPEFTAQQTEVARKAAVLRTPAEVVRAMAEHVDASLDQLMLQWIVRGMLAGVLITSGAFLSAVFSAGVEAHGPQAFLTGMGFVAGFSMVILSGSLLFTEVNISVPTYLLARGGWNAAAGCFGCAPTAPSGRGASGKSARFRPRRAIAMWLVSVVANYVGSLIAGVLYIGGSLLKGESLVRLNTIVLGKLSPYWNNGASGWFSVVVSGMLANLLVGMAAYNASVTRTLPGVILGIFLPVLAFVALGAAHSPANMGYFALSLINGNSPITWGEAWAWNIAPAVLGNALGGTLLLAFPIFISHGVSPATYRTKLM